MNRRTLLDTLRVSLPPLLLLAAGCGSAGGPDVTAATDLPVFTLSEPVLEIGTLDGPEAYAFAAIENVVPLGDGSLAVSDAGNARISIYDESGTFVRAWGRKGDGPGEFSNLATIHLWGTDSILAAERSSGRLSVFDLDGTLGRTFRSADVVQDSLFGLDSWLYSRFWVQGALTGPERSRVRAILDRLPLPRLLPGYRSVLVSSDGGLWIREPEPASAETSLWTRTDATGSPIALVTAPDHFRPTHVDGSDALGVWRGEADVNYVRQYRLVETGQTRAVPGWLQGAESARTAEAPPNEDELMALMRGAIRMMASAQEIHYSTHMSYSTQLDSLSAFEPPEGLGVQFVKGDARGWAAVFTHPAVDRICGLAYGFNTPPGWMPGMVICGPEAATAPQGQS